ncbi:Flp pilus assembly complex ATPase component TadA [Burkholderia multivorans]|uniref:ATPase, T2SS/T4P/T4SS family n=1 Tax=Burkholderia multivorans TaxID=87883 RepID=UPI001C968049|nr:ATPase, T2SS/T4P/T4SS family [Burkholderia multivorans]MBY4673914.1 Flp pilus assembly complex ATPase component TadA [Burkholderia multivorans]
MRLLDLGFSDLFVGPNLDWSWYRATSNSPECRPIPPEAANELDRFRAHLLALGDVQDERTNWDNEPLRIKRKLIDNGVVLYVIRRFKLDEYSMSSVRLQTSLAKELLSASKFFDSGAIAVFGPPGGGKTSTALSIVLDRLRHYGGTAWRLGCPIEVPMQGKHGKGWLYELNLKRDEQIADEIRELYRTVPKIVMVEEVRDGKTAREVVRAAGSGYLVAFAMHANDLVSGIGQFVRWAAQDDFEETASRVADFTLNPFLNP